MTRPFELIVSEPAGDVAYLKLPSHPGSDVCKMSRTIRVRDVIGAYEGPDVVLDFDERGVLVGIEVF